MPPAKRYLVTGGTGFIGAALVRALVQQGHDVRVFDNQSRGNSRRLAEIIDQVELVEGDVRDPDAVARATAGMDSVIHLAFVNGTEHFYNKPELVLEVGVKGMTSVLDACIKHQVPEIILASSSEVYHEPAIIPTDETVPLVIPDIFNPRYSYAAGKMISEVMVANYGKKYFERAVIFRPHNVYGPDMGFEHVIPQFVLRMRELAAGCKGIIDFPIQGTGDESRAFIYIDDFTNGLMDVIVRGKHLEIYHIGTQEELTMSELAQCVSKYFEREIKVIPGSLCPGGTSRRCPDITKLNALGFVPQATLKDGIKKTADWYCQHAHLSLPKLASNV